MGILRTDTISGLETPTPVTGSVVFDGAEDYLSLASSGDFAFGTGDFTIELWAYFKSVGTFQTLFDFRPSVTNGNYPALFRDTDGDIYYYVNAVRLIDNVTIANDTWNHISICRSGTTVRLFVNGNLLGSSSDTTTYITDDLHIASYKGGGNYVNGHISNFRILKGTALYTANFTPPVHELQPIGDTVLLCCNNPDSAGADGTGKTITVNGDAAASTFSPGLTRDFTSGTQFEGVAKFDTQGYFVPPSGTTEQRGGTRGVFYCGAAPARDNRIQYINIESLGNAQEFGDSASGNTFTSGGCGSSTRGVFGASEPTYTGLDFITFASTGNATTFGTIGSNNGGAAVANNTRGVWDRGQNIAMEYITIASLGNAASFGDSSAVLIGRASGASPTRGIFAAGYGPSPFPQSDVIDYITISTLGNAIDFGDISFAHSDLSGFSNSTRMVMGGGLVFPSPTTYYNNIEYITIATTGNSQDFGDLWVAGSQSGSASSLTRGVWAGLNNPSGQLNHIQYVTIATTGNALDFGDLLDGRRNTAGASNGHGGLS